MHEYRKDLRSRASSSFRNAFRDTIYLGNWGHSGRADLSQISYRETNLPSFGPGRPTCMQCPICGAMIVRSSRLRFRDWLHLIRLQFPVRCHNCFSRFYVEFAMAREVSRETKARRQKPRSEREGRHAPPGDREEGLETSPTDAAPDGR